MAHYSYNRRRVGAGPKVVVVLDDEDPVTTTLGEFLKDNEDGLDASEVRAIKKLRPGESYSGGGGASPEWKVTRK
jgi:hypothetical protein